MWMAVCVDGCVSVFLSVLTTACLRVCIEQRYYSAQQHRPLTSPSSFIQAWDWHWVELHGCAMCSAAVGLPQWRRYICLPFSYCRHVYAVCLSVHMPIWLSVCLSLCLL